METEILKYFAKVLKVNFPGLLVEMGESEFKHYELVCLPFYLFVCLSVRLFFCSFVRLFIWFFANVS